MFVRRKDFNHEEVLRETRHFDPRIGINDRIFCLAHGIVEWPKCEICGNPTKRGPSLQQPFRPFCSFACSRKPGSSTYQKAKQTNLVRFGYTSKLAAPEEIARRAKNGHGSANYTTAQKIKATNLMRYGTENVFSVPEIQNKIKNTHLKRYGGNFQTQRLGKKLELLNDADFCARLAEKYCISTISDMLGIAGNTVVRYFEKHSISSFKRSRSNQEIELLEFLKTIGIKSEQIIVGDRTVIAPKELDIYIPHLALAIEMNGLYWHSEKAGIRRNYHLEKTQDCEHKGIKLIHIFENEWVLKQHIVKSRLAAACGRIRYKIGARSCTVCEITTEQKRQFLKQHHIQGDCPSSSNLALFSRDEIVAVMTLGKSRFDKSAPYELLRFCCKQGLRIPGAFSRLLSKFREKHNGSIVSFADRRWSSGNVYKKNGFVKIGETGPAYHYFKGSSLVVENRQRYQKHKLSKLLVDFDPALSEWDNMLRNGYNRIWDCGNTKWQLND